MKQELKGEDVYEAVETGALIETESWRWGTQKTYVIKRDEKHYKFTVRIHHEEGIQDAEYGVPLKEVVAQQVTTTKWVDAPTEPSSVSPSKKDE